MPDPRFFVEELSTGTIRLSDAETRHAQSSKRLSVGESVVLFDGRGNQAAGRIVSVALRGTDVAVEPIEHRARLVPTLTLAVALPKGPRQDTLVEKCTELGVAAIWPILTQRTVSQASEHKLVKWRRKTIEAAKQSGQCWLPDLHPPCPLADVLQKASRFELVLAAMTQVGCQHSAPILAQVAQRPAACSILAFVGPEGGWTPQETAALTAAGAQSVSLGPNILRIETAAMAIAALVHAFDRQKPGQDSLPPL